jgi:hypothetical protein
MAIPSLFPTDADRKKFARGFDKTATYLQNKDRFARNATAHPPGRTPVEANKGL